jgi:rhodanese-related sulfurtransferase
MKWLQFITPAKSMDFQETNDYLSRNPARAVTLLDVRQPKEYEESHLPGATLIPLPELPDRMSELDPDKTTFVY